MKKTSKIIVPEQVEKTEAEVIEAMKTLGMASVDAVGMTNTHQAFTFLSELIAKSPETYKKLFEPETIAELKKIGELKTKKLGPVELMSLVGRIAKIFA